MSNRNRLARFTLAMTLSVATDAGKALIPYLAPKQGVAVAVNGDWT